MSNRQLTNLSNILSARRGVIRVIASIFKYRYSTYSSFILTPYWSRRELGGRRENPLLSLYTEYPGTFSQLLNSETSTCLPDVMTVESILPPWTS